MHLDLARSMFLKSVNILSEAHVQQSFKLACKTSVIFSETYMLNSYVKNKRVVQKK